MRFVMILSLMAMARGQENLDRCVALAQPLLSENHLVVPSTRPELQMVCDKWRLFVDCINKYVTSRYTSSQKSAFNGAVESAVRNVYKMCNDPAYSDEYLMHAPCIKQMTMDEDRCGDYYTNMARAVTEGLGTDEQICCLHRKFRSCMSGQRRCPSSPPGSSVNEFVETFLNNGLHVFVQKCRNYVFSAGHCAGAARHNRLDDAAGGPLAAAGGRGPPRHQLVDSHQHPSIVPAADGQLRPEHRGPAASAAPPRATTTPYQGWFRPETTTSVWLASNSLGDLAQAQRQPDSAAPAAAAVGSTLLAAALLAAVALR